MESGKALVVLSGGQDSTTCLHLALKEHGKGNVFALTFDYGQKHRIEIDAARTIAIMADVPYDIVDVRGVLRSTSPLTNPTTKLEKYTDAKQMADVIGSRVELTFVPMRNALFLTVAANRAIDRGCEFIYTGVCQEDNANYPDCRDSFIAKVQEYVAQALGTEKQVIDIGWHMLRFRTPLMYLSKAETCRLAFGMPACWDALAYSHTSYDGCYPPTDMNHANVLRAQGFSEAGLPDPLVMRAVFENRMPLPAGKNYDMALIQAFGKRLEYTYA